VENGTGTIRVRGGTVAYRVVGADEGIPLLVLHGGPGLDSRYLDVLSALAESRPVVFYDQLGSGQSDHPVDPSLWTVNRFVEELETVRAALGLGECHLFGHSWGGIVAAETAASGRSPVRSMAICNTPFSVPRYVSAIEHFRADLPSNVLAVLQRHEATGRTGTPEYSEAVKVYLERHFCRVSPWPRVVQDVMADIGMQVYLALWGATPFSATGTLQTYDALSRLSAITVPTLLCTGRFCPATPDDTAEYARRIPNATHVVFEHSSHTPMIEEPETFLAVVDTFLRAHDAGRQSP
jgi:proline iminopeptidase